MTTFTLSAPGSRPVNEDTAALFPLEGGMGFLVADGLGGHGGGDRASRLAADAFRGVLSASADPVGSLPDAFLEAQKRILAEQASSGNFFQMKTTAAALVLSGQTARWGHIGDTRLYFFSHARLKTRTLDHSVPQMLVMAGEIRERDIRFHPDRNKLLRVLGVAGETPRFELSEPLSVTPGQAFLLCSDGFWEWVTEREMQRALRSARSAAEWLTPLAALAEARGKGRDMDNYTAIAVIV